MEVEPRADCLAACGDARRIHGAFNITDLCDALTTARVIGDNYLQGYKTGRPGSCDTFIAR